MGTKDPADLVLLGEARDQAIARLSDAFAHDVIDVHEFETRITRAHAAATTAEVERTVADLLGAELPMAWKAAPLHVAAAQAGEVERVTALLGGLERHGTWALPRRLEVLALMGGVVLDFRDAVFSAGVTEVHVNAVMGGVHIVVPPTLSVEIAGTAIMGGFDSVDRVPRALDPTRPVLRVRGVAFMGGVFVETRLPGESEMDAHRRRRREHKASLARGREVPRLPGRSG
jgi:hypothetical protein